MALAPGGEGSRHLALTSLAMKLGLSLVKRKRQYELPTLIISRRGKWRLKGRDIMQSQ
jgi:hypothetical protein